MIKILTFTIRFFQRNELVCKFALYCTFLPALACALYLVANKDGGALRYSVFVSVAVWVLSACNHFIQNFQLDLPYRVISFDEFGTVIDETHKHLTIRKRCGYICLPFIYDMVMIGVSSLSLFVKSEISNCALFVVLVMGVAKIEEICFDKNNHKNLQTFC